MRKFVLQLHAIIQREQTNGVVFTIGHFRSVNRDCKLAGLMEMIKVNIDLSLI